MSWLVACSRGPTAALVASAPRTDRLPEQAHHLPVELRGVAVVNPVWVLDCVTDFSAASFQSRGPAYYAPAESPWLA